MNTDYFVTTIYKIDKVLTKRTIAQIGDPKIEELRKQIPIEYYDYLDIFLKKGLDTLSLLYKGVEYKIELEGELPQGHYSLYKIFIDKLLQRIVNAKIFTKINI